MTPAASAGPCLRRATVVLLAACHALLAACDATAGSDRGASLPAPLLDVTIPVGARPDAWAMRLQSTENALTESRAQLGKRLFFDSRLSSSGAISCASCHLPEHAFADPHPVSLGVDGQAGRRNAPSLVNLVWSQHFFWDGRAGSLEEQAGQPIENPVEMNLPLPEAVASLVGDPTYVAAFEAAYGGPPSESTLRKSLASFLATLVSGQSAYDQHLRGDDRRFGEDAQRGEAVFLSDRVGCFHCHPVGLLTNDGFFNNGSFEEGGDRGRQAITGRPGDLGKFKVPGLRNIGASGPYMHDGSVPTLTDVIEQYARGGRGDPTTDPQVRPISLSAAEKQDLLAFLTSLTDETFLSDPRYRP